MKRGKVRVTNSGKAVEIAARAKNGLTVVDAVFPEDGIVARDIPEFKFLRGEVKKPLHQTKGDETVSPRTGMIRVNKYGDPVEIVVYRTSTDMDVRFEDGTMVLGTTWAKFLRGTIRKDGLTRRKRA